MRPEISKMLIFIYPDLKDYQTVTTYPNIKGVQNNLFFFDHTYPEKTQESM